MKIAIVGATGLVGRLMLQVLAEMKFPVSELIPVASEKSLGAKVNFAGKSFTVVSLAEALACKPDMALFSAGAAVSLAWAKRFTAVGTYVIDNSSAWRMHADVPLIVPEVNAHTLTKASRLIANPNCSTIQLLLPLAVLHRRYGVKRLVISTYQSVSGTGAKALRQLEDERASRSVSMVYPHAIDMNCLPHCDVFLDNAYTKEEMKLVNETRKILAEPDMPITATAVRVPVVGGHSESVNVELMQAFDIQELKRLLASAEGVVLQDNIAENLYPMPIHAQGKNEVFVGRVRRDFSVKNGINMWLVADNLRKGAATNTVQIAQYIVDKLKVKS